MIEHCLFCQSESGSNATLESFASTDRAAFDPERGRLWVICARCRRWTLAPIEERWEIVEALERLTRDRGVVLGRTDATPSVDSFRAGLLRSHPVLTALSPAERVALEIAVQETHERKLLELEVDELERQWREEEIIASIADRELTPAPRFAPVRDGTRRD